MLPNSVSIPAVTDIRGAFNVQSTSDISSECSKFQNEAGPNDVIKGDFQCAGKQDTPSDATPTGSSATTSGDGGSGSSGSGSSGNFAGPIGVPSMQMTGVMGVIAAMIGLL